MYSNADVLNDLFSQRLDDPGEKAKLAAAGGNFIRDRLREESFARKILPPQQVVRADLQRSVNHDTLVKIVDIEPKSRAMSLTFRGQPSANVIRGKRYEIPFWTISSEKFEATEQELMAYEMPITKIIEDNSLKDVQEIEDRTFLVHSESCVQFLQTDVNGAGKRLRGADQASGATLIRGVTKSAQAQTAINTTSFAVFPIEKPDLTALFKLFSTNGTRLRCDRFLMTDGDFEDINNWTIEDFGDKVQSETVVDGYKYNVLMGRKFMRTIKSDILRDGNIYGFAAPEFFGRFYLLNSTKFYIDKIANKITWQAWEDIGMGFGNVAAVRKSEQYAGSVSTGVTQDTGFEAVLPMEEEDLGAQNHRVGEGGTFPAIASF